MPCLIGEGITICRPSPRQPAIMWSERVDLGTWKKPKIHVFHHSLQPFSFVYCWRCRKKRWAAYCDVIGGGWYDPQYYCAPGHGCATRRRAA